MQSATIRTAGAHAGRRAAGVLAALLLALAPGTARADTLEERWERLAQLSPSEKEELKEKQDRFLALASTEQDRLRELSQRIEADPAATRLMQVAARYAEWLKSLGASERSELLALPADKRVAKIKELMARQQAKQFQRLVEKKLPQEDLDAIFAWLEAMVKKHEAEILAALPADRRQRLESIADEKSRQRVLLMLGGPAMRERLPQQVWQANFEELSKHLSPEAKKVLEETRDPREKGKLIQGWVWAAMMSRMQVEADPAELRKLLQSPNISAEQRDYLESLPPERMQQELKRMYFWTRWNKEAGRDDGPGGFPFGRGSGGPGGLGRPFRGGPGGERGPGGEFRGPGGEPRGPGGEPRIPGTEERPKLEPRPPRDGEPRGPRPGEGPPQ